MPFRHTKTKQKSGIVVPSNNNNPTPEVSLTLNLTRTNATLQAICYINLSLRLLRSSDDGPHFTSSVFPLSSLFIHGFDIFPLSRWPLHPNSRTSPPHPQAGLLLEPLGTAVLMVPKVMNMQHKLMVS
ncbi:unnamed protein product [Musa banksii]